MSTLAIIILIGVGLVWGFALGVWLGGKTEVRNHILIDDVYLFAEFVNLYSPFRKDSKCFKFKFIDEKAKHRCGIGLTLYGTDYLVNMGEVYYDLFKVKEYVDSYDEVFNKYKVVKLTEMIYLIAANGRKLLEKQ